MKILNIKKGMKFLCIKSTDFKIDYDKLEIAPYDSSITENDIYKINFIESRIYISEDDGYITGEDHTTLFFDNPDYECKDRLFLNEHFIIPSEELLEMLDSLKERIKQEGEWLTYKK